MVTFEVVNVVPGEVSVTEMVVYVLFEGCVNWYQTSLLPLAQEPVILGVVVLALYSSHDTVWQAALTEMTCAVAHVSFGACANRMLCRKDRITNNKKTWHVLVAIEFGFDSFTIRIITYR